MKQKSYRTWVIRMLKTTVENNRKLGPGEYKNQLALQKSTIAFAFSIHLSFLSQTQIDLL